MGAADEGAPAQSLGFTQLVKAQTHLGSISPGSLPGNRIALSSCASPLSGAGCRAFVANGASVFSVHVPLNEADALTRGKEGIYVPVPLNSAPTHRLADCKHKAEVQSLALREGPDGSAILGSIDACGRAKITRVACGAGGAPASETDSLQNIPGSREPGWAGLAFSTAQFAQTATASYFGKDLNIYDGPLRLRSLYTLHCPTSVAYLPVEVGLGANILAMTEGHQVSLWDVRAAERGGCVARIACSQQGCNLYTTAWCRAEGGLLGAAGAERSVSLLEPRKWRVLYKWFNVLKSSLSYLHFLSEAPRNAVVAGLDYELLCSDWRGPGSISAKVAAAPAGRAAGPELGADGAPLPPPTALLPLGPTFRGDARWLGLAKAADQDVFAGYAASGNVYVAAAAMQL